MLNQTFEADLVQERGRLMASALKLTRDRERAEDLVQDTIVLALTSRHSFTPGTNFGAWLFTILRNRFISMVRRDKPTVNIDEMPVVDAALVTSEASVTGALELKEVAAAVATLPREHLEPLIMSVVDGMSYEEIAQATGSSLGTTKSRVYRARRQIELTMQGAPKQARGRPRRQAA